MNLMLLIHRYAHFLFCLRPRLLVTHPLEIALLLGADDDDEQIYICCLYTTVQTQVIEMGRVRHWNCTLYNVLPSSPWHARGPCVD